MEAPVRPLFRENMQVMFKSPLLWVFCPLQQDVMSAFAGNLPCCCLHLDLQSSLLADPPIASLTPLTRLPRGPSRPLPLRSLASPGHWPLSQAFVTSGHFTFYFWLGTSRYISKKLTYACLVRDHCSKAGHLHVHIVSTYYAWNTRWAVIWGKEVYV